MSQQRRKSGWACEGSLSRWRDRYCGRSRRGVVQAGQCGCTSWQISRAMRSFIANLWKKWAMVSCVPISPDNIKSNAFAHCKFEKEMSNWFFGCRLTWCFVKSCQKEIIDKRKYGQKTRAEDCQNIANPREDPIIVSGRGLEMGWSSPEISTNMSFKLQYWFQRCEIWDSFETCCSGGWLELKLNVWQFSTKRGWRQWS